MPTQATKQLLLLISFSYLDATRMALTLRKFIRIASRSSSVQESGRSRLGRSDRMKDDRNRRRWHAMEDETSSCRGVESRSGARLSVESRVTHHSIPFHACPAYVSDSLPHFAADLPADRNPRPHGASHI